jgi:hypothetical protein
VLGESAAEQIKRVAAAVLLGQFVSFFLDAVECQAFNALLNVVEPLLDSGPPAIPEIVVEFKRGRSAQR